MRHRCVAVVAASIALFGSMPSNVSAQQAGMPGMPGMGDTTKKSTTKPKAGSKTKKAPSKSRPQAKPQSKPQQADSASSKMAGMPMDSTMPPMKPSGKSHEMMSGPLGIPMDRMGSGTTWIPDALSLPSRRTSRGAWDLMAHGFVFGQYDTQSGDRGDSQLGSLNWMMLMVSRKLAGGHFQARTMLSLDPATVTPRGYPLLLQSGEAYHGEPLHDRQHPHDFFMELGALYQREFNKQVAWSIYAAPSGEPALGPVAFMHRPSGMDNPTAPLSHHWQDATHVSFGVVTAGLLTKRWQAEASVFNGREPDENRWNFDPIKLDSYSGRITLNPNANWSLTAGAGYLKSPEALHPEESMHRYTASILHGTKRGTGGQSAATLIWGMNQPSGNSPATHSVLFESETILDARNTFFGRSEFVQKTGEDLALDASQSRTRFNIGTAQLGYIRELTRFHWATVGVGAAGTLNFLPASLEQAYGSRNPVGAFFFLRVRPYHLSMSSMTGMKNMTRPTPSHSHE